MEKRASVNHPSHARRVTAHAGALHDDGADIDARLAATRELAALRDDAAIEALGSALRLSEDRVVRAAAEALGGLGARAIAAAPDLAAALSGVDVGTRQAVARALADVDPTYPAPIGLLTSTEAAAATPETSAPQSLPQHVVDDVPTLIAHLNTDERYDYVNQAYAEWAGLRPVDILGRTVGEIHGAEMYAGVRQRLREALSGQVVEFDTEVGPPGAARRTVRARYVPDVGDGGTIRGVYAVIADITDLARALEDARVSEARLRRLVAAIPDSILRVDSAGVVLDLASPRHPDAESHIGRPLEDFLFNSDPGAAMACVSRAIATREIQRLDLAIDYHGEPRQFEARCAAIDDTEVFVIVRDITDVQRLESELRTLNQQLEERVADRTSALEQESASRQVTAEALQARAEELSRVLQDAQCILWRSIIVEEDDGKLTWTPTRTDDPVFRTVLPLTVQPGQTYLDAWRDGIPQADRERMDRTGNEAVREGRGRYQQAYTCIDSRGTPRRMHEDVSVRQTGPGTWEAVGVARDVTSLTEAEAVQQQLEDRVADRTAALAREAAAHRETAEALQARAEDLDRVLQESKCILWRSEVTRQEDGSLTWTSKRSDEENFRAVLPIRVRSGGTHLDEWTASVLATDLPRLHRTRTDAVLEGRDRYQQAFTCFDEDGAERRVHEDVSLRQTGPNSWMAVGVAVDITSLTEAAATNREIEQRFQTVFQSAPLGMLIRDRASAVTHANQALCDMFGYTAEDFQHLQPGDITDPLDWGDEAQRYIDELIDGRRDTYDVDRRYIRKEGESFWVHLRVSAVRDAGGGLLYAVSMFEDITDRRKADEAIRNHEEERTRLLQRIVDIQEEERARIAYSLHDQVGQQLTSLLLGLKAAEASTQLTDMRAQAAVLREDTAKAVENVRQMAFDMRPSALDDMGVVTALRRDIEVLSQTASFHAVFRAYDEDAIILSPDSEVALYRVVNAALTNIVQHARATNVSVIFQPREGSVLATVEDDGRGFDTQTVLGGPVEARFGLLAMQERIANVGGELTFQSNVGEGSAVHIRLPMPEPDA